MLSTSVKSTISEYSHDSNNSKAEMSPASSSAGSVSSRKRRSCSDETGNDGQAKRLHSEAHSDSGALSSDEQEQCLKMITSPVVGYDSSSVVSYTVSYLMCVCVRACCVSVHVSV